jgi:hypothetical protein
MLQCSSFVSRRFPLLLSFALFFKVLIVNELTGKLLPELKHPHLGVTQSVSHLPSLPLALALLIDLLMSAVKPSVLTVQSLVLCLLEDLLFTGTMAKALKWERFNTNAPHALVKLGHQRLPLCVALAEDMAESLCPGTRSTTPAKPIPFWRVRPAQSPDWQAFTLDGDHSLVWWVPTQFTERKTPIPRIGGPILQSGPRQKNIGRLPFLKLALSISQSGFPPFHKVAVSSLPVVPLFLQC